MLSRTNGAKMSHPETVSAGFRPATEQGRLMKHQSTRAVYEHWNKKRGSRPAPARAEVDPTEIRHALSDTFTLAEDFTGQLRFRLAGTRVCALCGREIKGELFAALWNEDSRATIEELLAILTDEATGAVAGVAARTEQGDKADLELLLLPLAHVGHTRIRAIGVLAPLVPPYWLGARPVSELTLGALRHIEADIGLVPRMVRAASGSRVRHGFVVYSGGRTTPSGERSG